MQLFSRSIRTTLIAYFVILSVVPLAVVMLYSSTQIVAPQFEEQSLEQMNLVLEARQNALELWTDNAQSALNTFLTDATQNQRMVTLVSTDDSVLPSSFPTTVRNVEAFFDEQLKEQTAFSDVLLYDINGDVQVTTNPVWVDSSVADKPFFDASLSGTPAVYPPYVENETTQLFIYTPVLDRQGEVVGALAAEMNLEELSDILLNPSGLGDTGETYLVSKSARTIVTPGRFSEQVGPVNSRAISAALQGQAGQGIYSNYRQREVVGAYQWLPAVGAGLVAEVETSEALATSRQIIFLTGLLSVIAGVIALAIGSYLAVQFTKPITNLTAVATEIANGKLNQRTHITAENEIGQLSAAFNQMTERLTTNIDELIRARAQAQEATRVKSEFLAVMSHELRTPLNAIIGFAGIMLMSQELDTTLVHQVKRIQANSERLLSLINDVLDISRIEAGRMEIVPASIEIRPIMDKLRAQMSVLADSKALAFNVNLSTDIPDQLEVDQDALEKIITNLVSNAIKFTAEGSVTLNVGYQENCLKIEIADTGIGIPAHMHEIIFEPFRQVDSSSKRIHGGSGLGLAIVRSLCVAMNGSITLESSPGKGTTFIVELPLTPVQQAQRT